MMMRNMMVRPLAGLWDWLAIIPVEKEGRDFAALRTAIRHLDGGHVVGIFAEGGLECPRHINPYLPGVECSCSRPTPRFFPWSFAALPAPPEPTPACSPQPRPRPLPSIRHYAHTSSMPRELRSISNWRRAALDWPRHERTPPEHDRNA